MGDSGVPEVLTRFRHAVGGVGSVGPCYSRPGAKPLYRWCVSSRGDVRAVYERIGPWLGEVKRAEFRDSLFISAQDETVVARSSDEEVAWAAGLFDGEGSTMLMPHRTHAGYFIGEAAVTQSGARGIPEVLTRFRNAVGGAGKVYGPIRQKRSRKDVYRWKAQTQTEIEHVVQQLWPWLGAVKRVQAGQVLRVFRSQAPLPRGNPAWGSYKAHCVHGHEYATARIRRYVRRRQGGTQRRDSKQCLACAREQAAAKRKARRGNSS